MTELARLQSEAALELKSKIDTIIDQHKFELKKLEETYTKAQEKKFTFNESTSITNNKLIDDSFDIDNSIINNDDLN